MFANFFLISLYHKILFCEGYKGKVRRGYSEKKYKALQEFEKGKSTKDVAAKWRLPTCCCFHGRKMKKNL